MSYYEVDRTVDKDALGYELERLFNMQDRQLDSKRKEWMIKELLDLRVPIETITAGLRDLTKVDVPKLKFGVIRAAIFAQSKEGRKIYCDNCGGCGVISMIDKEKRSFGFACVCLNAKKVSPVWNGQKKQIYDGEEYIRHEYLLLGEEKYREIYEKEGK